MAEYEDVFSHRFTSSGADKVAGEFARMGKAAGGGSGSLGAMKDVFAFLGPRIEATGERLRQFSSANIEAYKESQHVEHLLGQMWKVKGYSPESLQSVEALANKMQNAGGIANELTRHSAALMASFDMKPGEIEKLLPFIASQADLIGGDMRSISSAIGKAFATGNYAVLRRFGITLGDAQMEQLKLASAMGRTGDAAQAQQGRAIALDTIYQAMAQNVPDLYARMETAKGRGDRLAATMQDIRAQMGQGASAIKGYGTRLQYNLLRPLTEGHEGMLKTAGGAAYLGGTLIKGAGQVGSIARDWVTFSAMLKLARAGKDSLKVATVAETAAEKAKIGVAAKEAAAIGKVGASVASTTTKVGLLARTGAALTGGMGFGMKGILGGFTSFGGAGSGIGVGSLLTGGAGVGAAVFSASVIAAAAAVAAALVYRDLKVVAETSRELGKVREGNENLSRMEQEAKAKGLQGNVQQTRERGLFGNLVASWRSDWSEEDTTSLRTSPRATGRTRTTPAGDIRVTIPGSDVVTSQAVRDRRRVGR